MESISVIGVLSRLTSVVPIRADVWPSVSWSGDGIGKDVGSGGSSFFKLSMDIFSSPSPL